MMAFVSFQDTSEAELQREEDNRAETAAHWADCESKSKGLAKRQAQTMRDGRLHRDPEVVERIRKEQEARKLEHQRKMNNRKWLKAVSDVELRQELARR